MARDKRPEMEVLLGLGVSPGIAIGSAVCVETRGIDVYRIPLPAGQIEREIERFLAAVQKVAIELRRLQGKVGKSLGKDLGGIFEVHALLLRDRKFTDRITDRIRSQKVNAEWAVYKVGEELGRQMSALDDEYLQERDIDLRDVTRYLLRALQGIDHHEISEVEGDVVVVADDLTPSDAVKLGREHVVGFAIETGGRTSHTAIIARSLKIPAVAGVADITGLVTDEDPVIVDGSDGKVILHPTAEILDSYRARRDKMHEQEEGRLAMRDLPSLTRDGVEVHLMANIDLPEELADARAVGAAGVGLYRSEFLYIEKSPGLPTEEEHLEIYRQIIRASAPYPAVIRTLDLGGRKLAQEVLETHEDNPVLGLRGIRLSMARPQLFETQLRALFRAGLEGELWLMIPLVTAVEELREFRLFADQVMAGLEEEGIPFSREFKFGIMIEVPSAAMVADKLAREVDFFSLGTNDLIQYALAVDRNNEHVSHLYQPLHPGILRMLRFVMESARRAGIEISLCGETAGDSRTLPLLLGLGLRRLSITPQAIPEVKERLRELSVSELVDVARSCEDLSTAKEVEEYLDSSLSERPVQQKGAAGD